MNEYTCPPASLGTPCYYSSRAALIGGVPDAHLALSAPVVVYWVASLAFHCLDTSGWAALGRYRIHAPAEVVSRNHVARTAVIGNVLLNQLLQTAFGVICLDAQNPSANHVEIVSQIARRLPFAHTYGCRAAYVIYWWANPLLQLLVAMVALDIWQYFVHRFLHTNKFMYQHVHSWHHRVYVPFAFASSYNHPLEGFLVDAIGSFIAQALARLNIRQAALLFSLAILKVVDDHGGYRFPFDPLQLLSQNNADFHDIHHQDFGMKFNFSAPFFVHWDELMSTRMTRRDIEWRKQKSRAKFE
ncbi:fatty acid hydroxylase superfamily-domain-containing protein [Mycena latifolia]|nr:fatty acid hydroxylase superfamily-domain-containing protein [Mycena latifolia]